MASTINGIGVFSFCKTDVDQGLILDQFDQPQAYMHVELAIITFVPENNVTHEMVQEAVRRSPKIWNTNRVYGMYVISVNTDGPLRDPDAFMRSFIKKFTDRLCI